MIPLLKIDEYQYPLQLDGWVSMIDIPLLRGFRLTSHLFLFFGGVNLITSLHCLCSEETAIVVLQWFQALQMAVSDNKLEDPALYIRLGPVGRWIISHGMESLGKTPTGLMFPAVFLFWKGSLFTKISSKQRRGLVLNHLNL